MRPKMISVVLFTLLVSATPSYSDDLDTLNEIYRGMTDTYQQYTQKASIEGMDLSHWMKPTNAYSLPHHNKKPGHQYDFIVVGSGSAGAVLASRLSEVPEWRVLLLEAGRPESLVSRVPLAAPALQFTDYDWHYFMERQPGVCLGLERQRMYWPRGKALGGTTVINYMIYTRGTPIDYDRWAAAGNPGWSYADVLPYFLKSERAALREADMRYHNVAGPQSVENIYQSPLVRAFIAGGGELGLAHVDYNSPARPPFGVAAIQATVLKGQRHSAARAFLQPARRRRNLHIVTSAHVTRVLIDPDTRTAYGVEYLKGGKRYSVGARKEVVLSAGTFNSPQLLMLAGVGPRQHLEELGVPVLEDLPVGQNMHDHLTYPLMAFEIDQPLSLLPSNVLDPGQISRFFTNGTGPLTALGGATGIGYVQTGVAKDTVPGQPDIELLFIDGTLASDFGLLTRREMRITDEVYNGVLAPLHNRPAWTVFPMLLHPKSVGHLRLRSTNPLDYPVLYGNFFTDPDQEDINTFVAGIRVVQRLAKTDAFRRLGARMNRRPIPGCRAHGFDSDEYWRCALRHVAVTLHHQVGTAKMGPADDPTAVVNHQLKVYGIKRLRVADCSVIPFALSAHTNAPAMMVGEKAADLIKADWLR